jgi:DNA helicase MCM9
MSVPRTHNATSGLTWYLFPGDDLTVYGVVMQRWKPLQQDVRCEVEIVLKANFVQVNNEQSSGTVIDEEVRKEFEDFWDRYKSDPFAGLYLRT